MKVIEKLVSEYDLGTLLDSPVKVTGGLTHTTYKFLTNKDTFIVKLLNPNIMKRETALPNFNKADELEKRLKEENINILPALTFGDKSLLNIDGQYLYVFKYYNGKSLLSEEITEDHCKIVARELAKIHNIEKRDEVYLRDEINIDWNYYLELAKEKNKKIYDLLVDKIDVLNESMINGNRSLANIPCVVTICHNDMDSKNILWNEMDFKIIDLECLGYSNPYIEFFQLALCWSGYERCNINFSLLKTFIDEYFNNVLVDEIDWSVIYFANFGRLEWLEFNLKRSFLIDCDSVEEQEIGFKEVEETLEHVVYYDSIKDELLKYFEKKNIN